MSDTVFIPGHVDVLILTYNNGPWLGQAIESALAQTYQNITVTVYDDCSSDNTAEVMAIYAKTAPQVRYVRSERNMGEALNTRAAYQNCRGEFIAVLHSDDLWHPHYLETLIEGLLKNPQCTFAYALWSRLEGNALNPWMHHHIPRHNDGVKNILGHLCLTNWILPSFFVFRHDAFLKVGGPERLLSKKLTTTGGPFGDHYTVTRLSTLGPCFASSQRLGTYRIHAQQSSNQVWAKTLHSTDRIVDMYDAIFFDKDLFPICYRYMAKANQMGRIMTDIGILNMARSMLSSHRLGPPLKAHQNEFMTLLIESLDDVIYDAAPDHPRYLEKFEAQTHIDQFRQAFMESC